MQYFHIVGSTPDVISVVLSKRLKFPGDKTFVKKPAIRNMQVAQYKNEVFRLKNAYVKAITIMPTDKDSCALPTKGASSNAPNISFVLSDVKSDMNKIPQKAHQQ